jgi:class 3 adenylate cyclase
LWEDPDPLVSAVERFLSSVEEEESEFERVLATVLFTDIVGSTEHAAQMGDAAWKQLLVRHHEIVRALLRRYRGEEVSTAGDGFFATFDGPGRAVRCANAIAVGVRPLGIEIRAGLHTGEIEQIGDDVGGLAVHIGARVGALAEPSECSSRAPSATLWSDLDWRSRRSVHADSKAYRGSGGFTEPNQAADPRRERRAF